MVRNDVPYLQTGTLSAGNRLLDPQDRTVQSWETRKNVLTSGHRACQGCAEALGARWALDTAYECSGGKLMIANSTGCLEVFTTPYPDSAWNVPWIHSLFANGASVASGIAAALKAQGREDIRVIAQGGDGGTTDIGLACISGMFERNDDVLYICYDNGAYMNTGVQRSSATPAAARTATTPPIGAEPGQPFGQGKWMPAIAIAHDIPYVASASVADVRDLERKVRKAMSFRGARYIQIDVPCPLGWGSNTAKSIEIARMGVQCGLFPLIEAEYGEITGTTKIRRRVDVIEYLKLQRRYAHIANGKAPEELEGLRALCERNIRKYHLLDPQPADTSLPGTSLPAADIAHNAAIAAAKAAAATENAGTSTLGGN
jgi:pyruvate ferredoxin oxidoreductase beta subunit